MKNTQENKLKYSDIKTSINHKGSFILRFKTFIRFFVSIFASREFGFVYCMLGTLSQIAHTYFLTESISSLDGWWKIIQALGISIFISSSLLFFTAIADNSETKESKRIHLAVNLFMVIEIIINMYYYSRHLLIDSETIQFFDFIFAILISCLIPVTIKLYAGLIQAKDWLNEFEIININSSVENSTDFTTEIVDRNNRTDNEKEITNIVEQLTKEIIEIKKANDSSIPLHEIVDAQIEQYMKNHISELDGELFESFDKHSELFIQQFQNKIQYMIDNKLQNYKA